MASAPSDATALEVVTFKKGSVLFRQGDKGDAAYLVNEGAVALFREHEGHRTPLATIQKGELLGEMAVVDGTPRLATAYALEDSTVTVISVAAISDTMRAADPFMKALIQMLLSNVRSVHDSYTPRARSLLDSVGALQRQSDMLAKFMQGNLTPEFKQALGEKLKEMNDAVKELRRVATTHREHDRRGNAIPSEADLPVG